MTDEHLAALEAEVNTAVDFVGNLIGTIDPALLPFIALGKVMAKGFPELLQQVELLIAGTAPTDADKAALAAKINSLAHPETL